MKIPKIIKAAGILAIVAIVAMIAFLTILSADLLSSFATGSERLAPDGIPAGKALVVYNPGLSGAPKDAATQIAADLQSAGYEVVLAGIGSAAAANLSCYDVIVAGGPVYGGKASSSVQSYLKTMYPPTDAKIGAFATGSMFKDYVTDPFPGAVTLNASVLLFHGDDIDGKCTGFVDALLK
ncbi:MAG: flavodoxin domain-containing protein [Methanocella sp.]